MGYQNDATLIKLRAGSKPGELTKQAAELLSHLLQPAGHRPGTQQRAVTPQHPAYDLAPQPFISQLRD
jgi:hypothetical protein